MKGRKRMGSYQLINFDVRGDSKGSLIAITGAKEIPFSISRIFYIFGTGKDVVRGKHANKKTKHILIALSGSCEVVVDDGKKRETFQLDSPDKGLFIDNLVWKDMKKFTKDCVLLVLANTEYDQYEYLRDYNEFKQTIDSKRKTTD